MILKDENLATDVDIEEIACRTDQFSGSDLHELCRCAAMNSFITHIKSINNSSDDDNNEQQQGPIFIRKVDFEVAFEKMSVKNLANLRQRFDFGIKLD